MKIGSVVRSTAGRDQGRELVVLEMQGEYLLLADGKVRKLACPKRKKRKHLADTGRCIDLEQVTSDKKLKRLLSSQQ